MPRRPAPKERPCRGGLRPRRGRADEACVEGVGESGERGPGRRGGLRRVETHEAVSRVAEEDTYHGLRRSCVETQEAVSRVAVRVAADPRGARAASRGPQMCLVSVGDATDPRSCTSACRHSALSAWASWSVLPGRHRSDSAAPRLHSGAELDPGLYAGLGLYGPWLACWCAPRGPAARACRRASHAPPSRAG